MAILVYWWTTTQFVLLLLAVFSYPCYSMVIFTLNDCPISVFSSEQCIVHSEIISGCHREWRCNELRFALRKAGATSQFSKIYLQRIYNKCTWPDVQKLLFSLPVCDVFVVIFKSSNQIDAIKKKKSHRLATRLPSWSRSLTAVGKFSVVLAQRWLWLD